MDTESITDLDPKIYRLAVHAKISVVTYVLQLCRKYICTTKRGEMKQNEQKQNTKVIEREEWISSHWIPVINARLECKENTLPHKAHQTADGAQFEWASCYLQENSHCTFIPHHFFRARAEWQYSLPSLCLFTALYMHLPALTGLPWISTPLIFTDREMHRSCWTGHNNLPCFWVSVGFMGYINPAQHGSVLFSQLTSHELVLLPTAVWNPIGAVNYLRSSMLPDYSPTTTYWSVPKASLGIGLWDRSVLASRTHRPQSWERTELDHESFGCTQASALLLSGFCCSFGSLEAAPQKLPHSVLLLLAAHFVTYYSTFTSGLAFHWGDTPLSMPCSGISGLSCRPV